MPVCNQCGKSRILHTGKYLSCEQMAEQGCGGWKKTRRLRLPEGAQSTREGRATSSAEILFFSIGCVGVHGSSGQAEASMSPSSRTQGCILRRRSWKYPFQLSGKAATRKARCTDCMSPSPYLFAI